MPNMTHQEFLEHLKRPSAIEQMITEKQPLSELDAELQRVTLERDQAITSLTNEALEANALRQRVSELESELADARKAIALLYKPNLAGEYRFDGQDITQGGAVVYDTFVSFEEGVILTTLHNLCGDVDFDKVEPMLDAILAATTK